MLKNVGGAVTAVVLCGGAGTRVHGADKPLLEFAGQPLVEHVLDRIRPQVSQVMISANRNAALYGRYGPVVSDGLPGFEGPLAGISAALRVCSTPWLLACAGDAPALPRDLVARFREALQERPDALAAIAQIRDRTEPLPVLLHTVTQAGLDRYLAQGRRSVRGWLDTLPLALVRFDGAEGAFTSLNSPGDFKTAAASRSADHPRICDCR